MVRSALHGWKVERVQVGPELGGEDTCEVAEVATEGRGFPAPAVVMKPETIDVVGQGLEADDRFFVNLDVKEAPVGLDGDVVVPSIGTDGCGEARGGCSSNR